MHVLVTNDDGPPSDSTSPYIRQFVKSLRELTDWDITVAVPNSQKSWIGKAHIIGHTVATSYLDVPLDLSQDVEGPHNHPHHHKDENWVLLDGTPATCANIGINHDLFGGTRDGKYSKPIDLVISGPNFGRNSTALFILSSGTLGAAMEAALCGVKGIGLSYAFESRDHNPKQIETASEMSVKLIEHLYANWPKDNSVDVYSINIPLNERLSSKTKIQYAPLLENRWTDSCFQPFESLKPQDPSAENETTAVADAPTANTIDADDRRKFRWAPNFRSVYESVNKSSPGNDGWLIAHDIASVTPLRATFQGVNNLTGKTIEL